MFYVKVRFCWRLRLKGEVFSIDSKIFKFMPDPV